MAKRIALAAVVAVAAAVALTSCVRLVQQSFDDQHEVTGQVTEVRLANGAGDVVLRSRDGATRTEVKRRVRYAKDHDKPSGDSHRLDGSTLVLDGCGDRCSVDYEVVVPSTDVRVTGENGSGNVHLEDVASVEVEVGSGDTTVRRVSGVVRLVNNSGDIDVADVAGDFTGRIDSGNSHLSNMRGTVTVDNGSGDVHVRMGAALSVRAESGSGNVTVQVPRSGAYKVDVDAGSGEQAIDVPNDPNASAELLVRAGSGDVRIEAT
ncbi:DUF4097 family beta strand repeat-containing protein [Saccharothrix hoggarensis]|uniref:DUF4097 family beta strand repeat-containing protein n=1 Tax=Saccharothrix hoggarensis TaxID=913853 RepID=A0ABW3QG84_9PSEU